MKKLLKVILSVCMLAGLTACGGNTDKQKQIADDFMKAFQNGKIETMKSLCSNNADLELVESLETMTASLSDKDKMGDAFVEKAEKSIKKIYKLMVDDYSIKSVKKDGEQYNVIVEFKTIDTKNVSINSFQTKITNLVQDYISDNMDELQDIYLKKGQKALEHYVYEQIGDDVLKEFDSLFEGLDKQKVNLTLSMEAHEDSYLITEMK